MATFTPSKQNHFNSAFGAFGAGASGIALHSKLLGKRWKEKGTKYLYAISADGGRVEAWSGPVSAAYLKGQGDWAKLAGNLNTLYSAGKLEEEATSAQAAGLNSSLLGKTWNDGIYTYEIAMDATIKSAGQTFKKGDAKFAAVAAILNRDYASGRLKQGPLKAEQATVAMLPSDMWGKRWYDASYTYEIGANGDYVQVVGGGKYTPNAAKWSEVIAVLKRDKNSGVLKPGTRPSGSSGAGSSGGGSGGQAAGDKPTEPALPTTGETVSNIDTTKPDEGTSPWLILGGVIGGAGALYGGWWAYNKYLRK